MRVLVTSTPGTGHLHPLVPLARELVLAGHEVVWATAASSCAKVESFGFPALPCGLDGDARLSIFLDRAAPLHELPPRQRRAVLLPVMFGEVAAPVMRDESNGRYWDAGAPTASPGTTQPKGLLAWRSSYAYG